MRKTKFKAATTIRYATYEDALTVCRDEGELGDWADKISEQMFYFTHLNKDSYPSVYFSTALQCAARISSSKVPGNKEKRERVIYIDIGAPTEGQLEFACKELGIPFVKEKVIKGGRMTVSRIRANNSD